MNENIDLTKILEGCPEGTKFYSTIYGEVSFIGISNKSAYLIELIGYTKQIKLSAEIHLTKGGLMEYNYDGECTIFPSKDQRDWSKFERFWDKPKAKKFDPKTFQPFDKLLVRDNIYSLWSVDFYSFYDINCGCGDFPIITAAGCYRYAIPYNDETKYLVGTNKDCPEYYTWWEK